MLYLTWLDKNLVRVDAWYMDDEYVGETEWKDYEFDTIDEFYKSEQYILMKLEAKEDADSRKG